MPYRMKNLLLFMFIFWSLCLTAQNKQDYVWLFGLGINPSTGEQTGYKFDFNEQPFEFEHQDIPIPIASNNSSICDSEGNLLFFSNGCVIYNSEYELMENGDSLNYNEWISIFWSDCINGYRGAQDVMIVPDLYNDAYYYIIHKPKIFNGFNEQDSIPIHYSMVDMNANNGLGKVIVKNKKLYEDGICLINYLTGITHQNGSDYWFLQPLESDSIIVTISIDEDGIHHSFNQNSHVYFDRDWSSSSGTAKLSPDGTKYALYNYYDQLHLYDFDRETGLLSNHQKINVFPNPSFSEIRFSSVEWSANSRFIYTASTLELHQIDTWESNIEQDGIRLIDIYDGTQDPFSTVFYLMAQAPDCKIYMCPTSGTRSYHVINNPNQLGTDCDFVQNGMRLPHSSHVGSMPNFPRFRVDEEEKCDPTIVSVFGDAVYYRRDLVVYPSPSTGLFTIDLPEDFSSGRLVVTNLQAQILKDEPIDRLTFEGAVQLYDLPEGIYNIEIYPSDNVQRIFYSKQVVKL